MKASERKLGWLLFTCGVIAFVFSLYLESFDGTKIALACFWLANWALSALFTYDLFQRQDLSSRSRTIWTALIWILPFVNSLLFLRSRNHARPLQPSVF